MTLDDTQFLTPEATADRLRRSLASVWRYARNGRLEAVSVLGRTRFRATDVERLVAPQARRTRGG
ncbi:MAG TPA: helix-turn-helix domain-containing protein [Polyangiaceae bacterium]|jgi:predicted site-specific integrase-resolvase|nr:helix-turn-helix domain-containing protein [Polyangiaceae bacterium]